MITDARAASAAERCEQIDLPDLDVDVVFLSSAPKPDPIRDRLAGWSNTTATNMRRVGAVLYSWTTNPRVQQNGSALGRVYAQRRGEADRDIGGFKVDRDGNVLALPREFAAAVGLAVEEEAS